MSSLPNELTSGLIRPTHRTTTDLMVGMTDPYEASPARDLARIILVVAAVVAAMLVATAIFGVTLTLPSLEITPDPAGVTIPF